MNIHNVVQGSPEWHALRRLHPTASEAPAMMGASKYLSRDELLRQKATGLVPEVSPEKQRLFDKGHAAEAKARPIMEERIGESLFPVTATDDADYLLASFDGITMLEDIVFEHKLWGEDLAAQVRENELDPHYYWQLEQQLLVSGAEKAIFVCSDGTEECMEWMEYYPVPGRADQLMAGWAQFEKDLAAYEAPEPEAPALVGREIMELPALVVELVGEVRSTNLVTYKEAALQFIRDIKTDLQTDQDFADAEKIVKFCGNAEKELDTVKKQALAQTSSIDELFRTVDMFKAELREKRLALDKLVKERKEGIKEEIAQRAKVELTEHVYVLNARLRNRVRLDAGSMSRFADAMKNKKTLTSLRGAVNDELARAKIEVDAAAAIAEANLATLNELAADYLFLFGDLQQIAFKPAEDFAALVRARVADHRAKEEARLEAERARIRAEEERRAQQQAARVVPIKPEAAQLDLSPPAIGKVAEPDHGPRDEKKARTFSSALVDWQRRHGINPAAMAELDAIFAEFGRDDSNAQNFI